MSYAIIETGGKQLRVEPGRFYDIELLHVEPQEQVTINKVLLVQHDGDVTIGQPFIEGATVEGTVLRHRRGKKVLVYKMRPKKKTRKKRGHRQEITQFLVNSITLNGALISEQEVIDEAQVAQTTTVAEEPVVETATAEETPATQTVDVQAAEVESVAEAPATVEAPLADEPDAQTVEPDQVQQAQQAVENVATEEPEAETENSQETSERESQ